MAKEEQTNVQDVNAARLKALQATIDKIEKDFGKGTIMKLGEQPQWDVQVIPSGSVALDHALGIGGYPRGRIVEIYGPESSGKTTLAIHAIAEAQKAGGIAAMIDAEHAFDRTYAKALGVNLDTLLISQPDNGEQALEIADNLIRSGAIDIIVIDSVAALTPKAEIVDLAVEFDIIHKSGSWFSYNGEKLAQGAAAVKQLLKDNVELCDEIEAQVREALNAVKD